MEYLFRYDCESALPESGELLEELGISFRVEELRDDRGQTLRAKVWREKESGIMGQTEFFHSEPIS